MNWKGHGGKKSGSNCGICPKGLKTPTKTKSG